MPLVLGRQNVCQWPTQFSIFQHVFRILTHLDYSDFCFSFLGGHGLSMFQGLLFIPISPCGRSFIFSLNKLPLNSFPLVVAVSPFV